MQMYLVILSIVCFARAGMPHVSHALCLGHGRTPSSQTASACSFQRSLPTLASVLSFENAASFSQSTIHAVRGFWCWCFGFAWPMTCKRERRWRGGSVRCCHAAHLHLDPHWLEANRRHQMPSSCFGGTVLTYLPPAISWASNVCVRVFECVCRCVCVCVSVCACLQRLRMPCSFSFVFVLCSIALLCATKERRLRQSAAGVWR